MRIAVIGPQNTGKTTFVKDFLKEFPQYETTDKTYRDHVKAIGLPINQETTEDSQRAIMEFLYDQIVSHPGRNIIFDRCVIDNYVYTHSAHLKGSVSKEFLIISERKMYDHLAYLDCIFFIPTAAGVKLVKDAQRDVDPDFIDLINRLFMEALFAVANRTTIPIFVVTGNREERIRTVKQRIL